MSEAHQLIAPAHALTGAGNKPHTLYPSHGSQGWVTTLEEVLVATGACAHAQAALARLVRPGQVAVPPCPPPGAPVQPWSRHRGLSGVGAAPGAGQVHVAHLLSPPDAVFHGMVGPFTSGRPAYSILLRRESSCWPLTHHPELPLGLGEDAQKDEDGIPREEGTVVCGKRIPAGEEQFIWGKGL